ncbi:uncharacterized protein LAESUDRAFT_652672 [Laetiporus sulphureus 93-53]|uniref:RNI-like protein n=1 Tax=Laetiporus sulphureus 93-53 TaxID=1314785 RepID=A0A165EEU7_9APHY|nr:uncharacterized protein LAESUDRAFT_652672 [Laetiporus sulphureus 93-53]KZT06901.1 hypothetical protein LAESUDRAFT_652672 [Laetiporus sulphureus 93-53]
MNGLSESTDHEQPTETTALLVERRWPRGQEPSPHLPLVEPVILHIQTKDIDACSRAELCPYVLSGRAEETAFLLVVLLRLRGSVVSSPTYDSDIWRAWMNERERAESIQQLDRRILQEWSDFLADDRSAEEIGEVLWSSFYYRRVLSSSVLVVDFLSKSDVPPELLTDRLFLLSIRRTWRQGRAIPLGDRSLVERLLCRLDAVCTPRVLHAIDLSFLIAYLKWSLSIIPPLLVLAAFLSHLPFAPSPDDFAYAVLFFAFSWIVLELHTPRSPSPLYFLPFESILPLATLIWHGIFHIILPVVVFFLPALILSLLLLSTSLYDIFPSVMMSYASAPAPIEARTAFLSLFAVIFLLMICSLVMLVLIYPSLSSDEAVDRWDRYSKPVGLQARKALFRVVAAYSAPHLFPPPLNLIQLLVRIPVMFLSTVGGANWMPAAETVNKALWRLTVAPLGSSHASSNKSNPSARPTKRRKNGTQPTEEDLPTPLAQASAPTATALSIRSLPSPGVPSLANLCIRVFAGNLAKLHSNATVWEDVRAWLKALPDYLVARVFAGLKATCPTILSNGLIVAYFLRGTSIALDRSLPGANRHTIAAIRESPDSSSLQELEISDFDKEPDSLFASVVAKLPHLRMLVLRGCAKVGEKTTQAISKSCPQLAVLNLNYTSVTPASLAPVLLSCHGLEVLKVAGISSWTDASFAKLWSALSTHEGLCLTNIRTLKLRQTSLGEAALGPFLSICPNLQRVDLSFTLVRYPSQLLAGKPLEKLSLTSTKVTSNELVATLPLFPKLITLNIAALGGGQGSSAAISNTSAMNMTDQTLRDITNVLAGFTHIERVNLVGNSKLGITGRRDSAIAEFVRRVGRRCKMLNLASIPSLRSSDLEGLVPDTVAEGPSALRVLILNNTVVDDEAAPFISSCPDLETLSVGGTRFTSAGLFPIIDACMKLQKLDLTSCRGVKVGERRRFFEVWEEEWHDARSR